MSEILKKTHNNSIIKLVLINSETGLNLLIDNCYKGDDVVILQLQYFPNTSEILVEFVDEVYFETV